jgi:hypothetical protein
VIRIGSILSRQKVPQHIELEMLLQMIGPPIQFAFTHLIDEIRAIRRQRSETFSRSRAIQPGTAERRLVEQAMYIGAPDETIATPGAIQLVQCFAKVI